MNARVGSSVLFSTLLCSCMGRVPDIDRSAGDAGVANDAGVATDAGEVDVDVDAGFSDAGVDDDSVDAGVLVDAGVDGGEADAGVDAGMLVDAGVDPDIDPGLREPPDPLLVGGPLTAVSGGAPFLTPVEFLPPALRSRFSLGRELFVADWVEAGGQPLLDGLGPLFHASSCMACHPADRRATSILPELPAPNAGRWGVEAGLLIRLGRVEDGVWGRDAVFGAQLQPRSLAGPGEGVVEAVAVPSAAAFVDVARTSPALRFVVTSTPTPGAQTGGRLSPVLVGTGLLDRIDDEDLLLLHDADDRDGDGISGRAHILEDGQLGRFGWKALAPSSRAQTEAAFANDLGVSTPSRAIDCPPRQSVCADAPTGGTPEIDGTHVDHVVTFMAYLTVPAARRTPGDAHVARGAAVFDSIGCSACHVETQTTSARTTIDDAALAGVVFHPYTDLLLHDLGPDLADIGEGDAAPQEWRTPPLWGLGLVEAASPLSSRFLHDGRAVSIADAIDWHGGEATAAREAWQALGDDDRAALLAFLRSL